MTKQCRKNETLMPDLQKPHPYPHPHSHPHSHSHSHSHFVLILLEINCLFQMYQEY